MGEDKEQNKKRAKGEGAGPTRSFDGSVVGPGRQIGPFRIEHELGRGGAGVVYLAHDTKLNRSVAIKSLPPEVKDNPKALSRFTREARVLASLNHPNIATIHEVREEAEGLSYLVLEYVPGQTLAERIVKKPLKLQEALTIALQIAEAVAAAHEHDVIHRDLKPGNIKITEEGKVKVLDFGLAKVVGSEATDQQTTITEPGRVIGTPAYMSPEQARGQATDKRGDIWAFGCVLFEMLTATVPFKGETISDTLSNILQTNPDWQALPHSTPANILVLLRRCLEKNPCRRLRDIGDAGLEISETLNLPVTASTTISPATIKSRSKLWWLGIACSLVGLIVGIIAASLFLSRSTAPSLSESSPAPTRRTVIRLPENQVLGIFHSTTFGLRQPAFALSPDGKRLVYVAHISGTTQLCERMMNQFEVRPIMGTEGASAPFFSPDGQSVGFFAEEKLNRISLLGGEVVNICSSIAPKGGSWGSDGMIYFTKGERLLRVPASGGEPESLGSESEIPGAGYPQVLPGNKAVLISSKSGAMLYSLETGDKRILVRGGQHVRYVPTGHLIYVRAGAIEAVPFNLTTLEVAGRRIPILEGVLLDSGIGSGQSVGQLAFSEEGLLVYAPGSDIRRSIPTWLDHQGNLEPLSMPARIYGTLKLSPDGKRLAILVHELQSNVYIYDVATGTGTKLTLEGENYYPLWTPDSRRIVFSRLRKVDGQYDLLWALADGSGKPELLHSGPTRLAPYSWSPDGKLLAVYDYLESRDICDIFVLSLEGERILEPIIQTKYSKINPAFSPDGRWIAYSSNRDGKYQIYVRPYPTMDRVIPISREFGEEPVWSVSGDKLFYRNRSKWMVVSISTKPEFEAGTPEVVFEGPYVNVTGLSYDVAPDGQRFLVLKPEYDDSQVRELHVVTNWFEELKRLVPVEKKK